MSEIIKMPRKHTHTHTYSICLQGNSHSQEKLKFINEKKGKYISKQESKKCEWKNLSEEDGNEEGS